jgi:scyllo-inositol 2-dehydrogenase (NADP+)
MIRAGLVGFGMAGTVFHGPLISSIEGLELAAVVERSSNKAEERFPGIITYRSVDAMLADRSLGLFVVSTPSGTHYQIARQILEAGKHVIVDKPMATASSEIARLMELAASRNLLLVPFHNRRWDSDFLTIQKLVREASLGRLVHFESRFDRWRPTPPRNLWKEDPALGGGVLLDLGTHLADQALVLFGLPDAVFAEIRCERDGACADDAFTMRLRYADLTASLGANCLTLPTGPRFYLRGTKGNYGKWGLDSQEAALKGITRIENPAWGQEPVANWGTLNVDRNGEIIERGVEPIPGDYRRFYEGVRDALMGMAAVPVPALAAWRVARLLEWAVESSAQRREVPCDWSMEPMCEGAAHCAS